MILGKEETREEAETKEKSTTKRIRRSSKKEEISLDTLDSQLQTKPKAKTTKRKKELSVSKKETTFPEGTRLVDAGYAIKMLRDTNYRFRNICEKVAYLGRGKQKYFVLEMSSWMVVKGGILFVPVRLADFRLLEKWERLKGYAPEGFVAFRRR